MEQGRAAGRKIFLHQKHTFW